MPVARTRVYIDLGDRVIELPIISIARAKRIERHRGNTHTVTSTHTCIVQNVNGIYNDLGKIRESPERVANTANQPRNCIKLLN